MKTVTVAAWTGWMPGVFTKDEWARFFLDPKGIGTGQDPLVPEIPPMMKRRMSRLNRMSAAVAFSCCRESSVSPRDVPLVFASRHGEMGALMGLLSQMAEGTPVSPTAFSHSVHHTSGSYFSIASGNKRPLRSLAGGEATFGCGFLDALGLLGERENTHVLLLMADEIVPPVFEGLVEEMRIPFAVGVMLSRALEGPGVPVSFDFIPAPPGEAESRFPHAVQALDFVRWLAGPERTFVSDRGEKRWMWSK